MPYAPKPTRPPWLPTPTASETNHQGRKERSPLYNTPRWRNARRYFLLQNPLCVECKKAGKVTEASVVDHIQRVNAGGSFWDQNNWQPMCNSCHQRKSALERHGK